jgi:hypothetical protein
VERNQDGVFIECCLNSALSLPAIKEAPFYLRHLFTGNTAEAQQLQKSLRAFNCAFAYIPVDCKIDWQLESRGGIRLFAIHGQLSHQTGPLQVGQGAHGSYAQLYILDTERAVNE